MGDSLSARLHHATSFLRATPEFRTEHFDTQLAEGFLFTTDDVSSGEFFGRKTRAALVTVKYLPGIAMTKGITIGRRLAGSGSKVGALAAGFFTRNTKERAIVLPTAAVPGFFVVNIGQSMRYFMQHRAANKLWGFLCKTGNKMAR